MFAAVDKAWGGIDILVNNAGIDGARAAGWEAEIAAWRKVIEVNLLGAFHCAREALRRMVAQKNGVVLTISSVHEEIAWSGYSAYTASKAAVGMLTKTLAQEAAPYGVRVLSLAPGAIKTPINHDAWATPEKEAELLKLVPYDRVGEPDDIGRAAVWLASDQADYMTGATLFVDGGMTLYPGFRTGG